MAEANEDWDSEYRWRATVTYKTNGGPLEVDYTFEEISDLEELIERGPNFYAVERILIVINASPFAVTPTIEEAEAS